MSDRNRLALVNRFGRRAIVITGSAATALALLAGPAHAAPTPGTCYPFDVNTPATGINVSFPMVHLSPGTTIRLTAVVQAVGGDPQAMVYFWDGQSAYWQVQLPEIFGGEWRQGPRVNDPREVAISVPGANMALTVYFDKEYFDTAGNFTGAEWRVPVRMADGSECRS